MGKRILHTAIVTALSAVVLVLAITVTFGVWSYYVLDLADQTAMQPGTIQYETREFWLSIEDLRQGRNQWTAELPDIVKRSH